ncbi:unnamed protein product [Musa hybrid cultivar]
MGMEAEDGRMSLSDTVFSFLEEGERGAEASYGSSCGGYGDDGFDSGDEGTSESSAKNEAFWESQKQLLQEALSRTSSTEAKLLQRTKYLVNKMLQADPVDCTCSNRMAKECRNCALACIAQQLRELGYDSALCKSKWTRSADIPSGQHSYIDVVMEARNSKKGTIRLVIEPNLRAEFEMARGSREYNSLVSCLPKIFVGKSEKLRGVVKIMCAAAKKCMKENKMHMAPWRKHKYMQSKWFGTPERTGPGASSPAVVSDRQPKLRASMLTFDLHCTEVEVS